MDEAKLKPTFIHTRQLQNRPPIRRVAIKPRRCHQPIIIFICLLNAASYQKHALILAQLIFLLRQEHILELPRYILDHHSRSLVTLHIIIDWQLYEVHNLRLPHHLQLIALEPMVPIKHHEWLGLVTRLIYSTDVFDKLHV